MATIILHMCPVCRTQGQHRPDDLDISIHEFTYAPVISGECGQGHRWLWGLYPRRKVATW